jgi:hypothetical protein
VRTLPLVIVSLSLASCASQTQYIRADGNPTTKEQIAIDEEACNANPQDQYCMIEKGYFLVASDKVAEKNAQLFTIVAQNRRQAELAAKAAQEAAKKAKRKKAAARKRKQKQQSLKGTIQEKQSMSAVPKKQDAWTQR